MKGQMKGETQDEKQEPQEEKSQGETTSQNELEIEIDEASGRRYSYNKQTGISSWIDDEPVPSHKKTKNNQNNISEQMREQTQIGRKMFKPQKSFADLLRDSDWIERKDETGRIYYEDTTTNATQWGKPDGLVEKMEKSELEMMAMLVLDYL